MSAIPISDPSLPEMQQTKGFLGPVVCKTQYDKILNMINLGVKNGAELLYGGACREEMKKGLFIKPTLLHITDEIKQNIIWSQEIFGPVLCYKSFNTEQEAIAMANDSDFGLGGAVFSSDLKRADRVVRRLRVGVTWVNCSQPCFSQLPWGGLKRSGIGRDLGEKGLQSYLEAKTIVKRVVNQPWGWYTLPENSREQNSQSSDTLPDSEPVPN